MAFLGFLPPSSNARAHTHSTAELQEDGEIGRVLIPLGRKKGMSEKGGLGRLSAADSSFAVV